MRRAISISCGLVRCWSAMPWSCSSTKRLSRPKMSCSRAARRSASATSPASSAWSTTPPRHPVVAIRPVVVPLEQLPVDPRLVVVALEVGGRGQLHQVAVALDGLGQEGQVVVELLAALDVAAGVVHPAPPHRALVARLAGHVGLGADDRHDALVAAGLVEVEDPVHVPVVRDAERRLAVGHRRRHEVSDPRRAVEHGELGVGVQMRKRPLRHRPSFRHVKLTPV